MPRRLFLKNIQRHLVAFIGPFLLGMGVLGVALLDGQESVTLSSHLPIDTKTDILRPETHYFKKTHKLKGPLAVLVQSPDMQSLEVGDTFVLVGQILSRDPLERVDFQWILPSGVEYLSGPLQGTLTHIKAHQPQSIELTLRKLEDNNLQVHLQASGKDSSMRFSEVAQFNTQYQQLIQGAEKSLHKRTEKHLQSQGHPYKVFY